jgi:hypothetical protein
MFMCDWLSVALEWRSRSRRGSCWDSDQHPRVWLCKVPVDSLPLQQVAKSPDLMTDLRKMTRRHTVADALVTVWLMRREVCASLMLLLSLHKK